MDETAWFVQSCGERASSFALNKDSGRPVLICLELESLPAPAASKLTKCSQQPANLTGMVMVMGECS
jgi:hypothetical protein